MAQRCACPPAVTLNHNLNRIACLLCLVCSVELGSSAAQNTLAATTTTPKVASGTVFVASLKKSAHADKLRAGDKVDFESVAATLVGGRTVVPEKAVFHGRVVQSIAAKEDTEKTSHLSILVDSVTWKNKSLPVCASIAGFGSRQINTKPEQTPLPTAVTQASPDWVRKQAVTENRAGVDLNDRNFGLAERMPEWFNNQESSITIYGEGFVKGITIQRSATSPSVLNRKNKNVDLPGGLLVALRQMESESACSEQMVP